MADKVEEKKKEHKEKDIEFKNILYKRDDIPEIINIQPNGNKAKPYQVKQVHLLFQKYNI